MLAVAYDAFAGPATLRELPEPGLPAHGALLRVEATGVCRSDWHGWMGHDPDIRAFPHVPGHELAGVVERVGPGVRGWAPGARVTLPFVCACGTCPTCRRGDHQVCERQRQPGFTHWGSWAERVAVDWADVNLVALPPAVDAVTAASLGCRFATAFRAVLHVGRVRAGERVVVVGCGGVGLSAVMVAAAAGAHVVAIDVRPDALALAQAMGAHETAADAAGVRDADVSLDAVGSETTLAAALGTLRRRGRHVQVGLLPDPPRVPMDRVIGRELEVLGSHGMAAHAYPAMLAMVASGRLRPEALVTRRIGLDAAPDALAAMGASAPAGVTVIEPGR